MALKELGSRIFRGSGNVLPQSCVARTCDGERDSGCNKMVDRAAQPLLKESPLKQARSTIADRDWSPDGDREWDDFSSEIRHLVQHLVERIEEHGADPDAGPEDSVMLDVQVGGVRCMLVRRPLDGLHPPPAHLRQDRRLLAGGHGRPPPGGRADRRGPPGALTTKSPLSCLQACADSYMVRELIEETACIVYRSPGSLLFWPLSVPSPWGRLPSA